MTYNDWHATYEQLEQRHEYLQYFRQERSHQGQLLEVAADALAKAGLAGKPVPVPKLPGGHVTIRLFGRRGERALVLEVLTRG